MTSRTPIKDDIIDGYVIPKGTLVNIVPAITHQMKEYWGEDVHEFNPMRWLDVRSRLDEGDDKELDQSSGIGLNKPFGAYLPFLAGPSNCIGQKFSVVEIKVILSQLIRFFHFDIVEGLKVGRRRNVTWKPDPGLKLKVSQIKSTNY